MAEVGTRLWKEDDAGPRPFAPETVDPLETGCARALAHALKHDSDSDYATMAAREFLVMWRFVTSGADKTQKIEIDDVEWWGAFKERKRISKIIRAMITERLRFIGLVSAECARERTLALGALQDVLDAIDPPTAPVPPLPVAAREFTDSTEKCAA